MLNEDTIQKVFWSVEEKLIKLARRAGKAVKLFTVFDMGRVSMSITYHKIEEFHK